MTATTLKDTLQRNPGRALAGFLALHAAVWTLLPTALYPNLPLDLIEALTYGREWQLGYDKLPPLPWWLVEIVWRTIGFDFAYYLLAQVAVCVAFLAVWAVARPMVGVTGALIALMIVDGLHYLNFTAAKLNHDVIQLPLWALAGYALHRALRQSSGRFGDLRYWLLLGIAIGLSLWAKYFVVTLAVPISLFVLFDRDARKALATPGPYIAAAAALIVMMPHLVWLVQNDFLPLSYAEARAQPSRGLIDHLWHPIQFAIGQGFFMLPALLIAAPLLWPRAVKKEPVAGFDDFDRRIVTLMALGPFASVIALAAISGRGTIAMWGYPLWMFLGLWIVMTLRVPLTELRVSRTITTWAVVFFVFACAFVAAYAIMPVFDGRYRAVFFPGGKLGEEMSTRFRALTGKPLAYIVGSMWDGGNTAHYSPLSPQPRVLIDGRPARAPWIDLADLRSKGAIVVWTGEAGVPMPVSFRDIASDAEIQPPFALPNRRGGGETQVNWAVLRPRPTVAAKK